MKIVAVCGFGVGSSVIAKMNIESIVASRGDESEITVETVDLGSVTSVDADLFVTTRELVDQFPDHLIDKSLVLENFINLDEIREQITPKIDEFEARQ